MEWEASQPKEAVDDISSKTIFTIAGRITARRGMGKVSFLDLRDGAGKIQLFYSRDTFEEKQNWLFKELDIGDFIGVSGIVFRTKSAEPTIRVDSLPYFPNRCCRCLKNGTA